MASGLSNAFVLALFVTLAPGIFGGTSCDSYRDRSNSYHPQQSCWLGFCCGDCYNRYCCSDSFWRLTEDAQDNCPPDNQVPFIGLGVGILIFILAIVICCCVCPCCCLYKLCRKPRPVIATTTTVVTSGPQQYPQQQTVPPGQPIQHYPPYQPMPVQPGYPSQPMPQGYGAQNMPTSPYKGQPFVPGPPPTYQEATGPGYPVAPYSQAAFNLDHPAYPPQPPVHPAA
ncbi:hypothetical protein fugu_004956 [Takifugu bimaculatus]|uniref:Protein shisa-5 n=1 Tax=Takifugu bimaculatus TaxID=433685 RepID=A0A4Z2B949_9TELE|nr:hypothetical protein fugu_004956 [Takifugu bimaculatus]